MEIEAIWERIQAAFSQHGKIVRRLTPDRRKAIRFRAADGATPEELVCAVHGYAAFHGDDYDTFRKWHTPETVFRASKFWRYVEAWEEQQELERQQKRAVSRRERERLQRQAHDEQVREERRLRGIGGGRS